MSKSQLAQPSRSKGGHNHLSLSLIAMNRDGYGVLCDLLTNQSRTQGRGGFPTRLLADMDRSD